MPDHLFWNDGFSYREVSSSGLTGLKQVTDAWLAELARRHEAQLATLDPYQRKEKSTMATQDYNEALTFAIDDLIKNWHGYRRRYEEWLRRK